MDSRKQYILFVQLNEGDTAELARSLLNAAAEKYDLIWSAEACSIANGSSVNQLELSAATFPLVIGVGSSEEIDKLKAIIGAPMKDQQVHYWLVNAGTSAKEQLSSSIEALAVQLILKGGKRVPIEKNCPSCGRALSLCVCRSKSTSAKISHNIRVSIESKGRGGKKVTIISGFNFNDDELTNIAKDLKQSCGTGGTVKDGKIEIQGDQRDRILAELTRRGFKAKRAGG